MAPSANFNTLLNIVYPNKKGTFYALEMQTKSAHLKYSDPSLQSEIVLVLPSTDEWDTWKTFKE